MILAMMICEIHGILRFMGMMKFYKFMLIRKLKNLTYNIVNNYSQQSKTVRNEKQLQYGS